MAREGLPLGADRWMDPGSTVDQNKVRSGAPDVPIGPQRLLADREQVVHAP